MALWSDLLAVSWLPSVSPSDSDRSLNAPGLAMNNARWTIRKSEGSLLYALNPRTIWARLGNHDHLLNPSLWPKGWGIWSSFVLTGGTHTQEPNNVFRRSVVTYPTLWTFTPWAYKMDNHHRRTRETSMRHGVWKVSAPWDPANWVPTVRSLFMQDTSSLE